ncbi:MAG: hypothetical protein KME29_14775 [Calothrix sp. FI2-JRJ7]|jgi:hypothetical protein|nr:hypothetical protein [Calothrix sp. FI2-JRJ7]
MADNQPRDFDVILGGDTAPPPVAGVVLGGFEGVKNRLGSSNVEVRVAALSEALNYGDAGLDLVIEALDDSSQKVQLFAGRLLKRSGNSRAKEALLDYNPYLSCTKLDDWVREDFDIQTGITNADAKAYAVNLEKLKLIVHDSKVNEVEALICENSDYRANAYSVNSEFDDFVTMLFNYRDKLINLKALYLGTASQHCYPYRLGLGDLSLILEGYPNLEVLEIKGYCNYLQLESKRHNKLKTLIIDTENISCKALTQIYYSNFPNLEYLELDVSGYDSLDTTNIMQCLNRIFAGHSLPNLIYLGLHKNNFTDKIASAIAKSPIIEQLAILDLSIGNLTTKGAEALYRCPGVNNLHLLNVSRNHLSSDVVENLYCLNCQVIAEEQESEEDRYNSVWE